MKALYPLALLLGAFVALADYSHADTTYAVSGNYNATIGQTIHWGGGAPFTGGTFTIHNNGTVSFDVGAGLSAADLPFQYSYSFWTYWQSSSGWVLSQTVGGLLGIVEWPGFRIKVMTPRGGALITGAVQQ